MNSKTINKNQFDNNDSEINPHMPQYIVKAPWYLNQTENSLNHQKTHSSTSKIPITQYTERGVLANNVYKYRKGACENCGAMTHKTKECCERPRKRGAKFTQSNFRPDEYIKEIPLDYEGKRDRWNGYQPEMGKRLLYEYQKLEEEKNKIKEEKLKNAKTERERRLLGRDEDLEEDISSDEENDIPEIFKRVVMKIKQDDTDNKEQQTEGNLNYTEEANDEEVMKYFKDFKSNNNNNLPNKLTDIPKRILYQISTSKSLHIGEDYSKYLLNLALNSAYYDAKSRSMRENPLATTEINTFKGENSLRHTGDAAKLIEMENFVNNANLKNKDLNLNNIAMPSQAELFYRYINEKKDNYKSEKLKKAIEKYGGDEHFKIPESIKISEKYETVDNSRINNTNTAKSKYEEDVFINGHTSVWGSFYHDILGWGYKCCYSFKKESICEGETAKKVNEMKIKEFDEKMKLKQQEQIVKKEFIEEKTLNKKRNRDDNDTETNNK